MLCVISVYSESNRNSIEIGLCVQIFTKLLLIIADFVTVNKSAKVMGNIFIWYTIELFDKPAELEYS